MVITPHFRELARVLATDAERIASDPAAAARAAADELGVTVLLKGHTQLHRLAGRHEAASPPSHRRGPRPRAPATRSAESSARSWPRTRAQWRRTRALLARLAATASVLHGLAAERASGGGPFVVLELAEALPAVIAGLLGSGGGSGLRGRDGES